MTIRTRTFTLTKDHITLVRALYIETNDEYAYGPVPMANPKRPFGDSDITLDIVELISGHPPEVIRDPDEWIGYDSEGEIKKAVLADGRVIRRAEIDALRSDLATALQIILVTGSFVPGDYARREAYDTRSWELIS